MQGREDDRQRARDRQRIEGVEERAESKDDHDPAVQPGHGQPFRAADKGLVDAHAAILPKRLFEQSLFGEGVWRWPPRQSMQQPGDDETHRGKDSCDVAEMVTIRVLP
jgi:hypothetical protein